MKYLLTLFLIVLLYSSALAQASAVVFSEAGEKFTVILNGEKKNEKPQTNVKIQGLTAEFYQARIDFEDPLLKDFAEGNFAVQRGSEVTYIVKKNKKGEYVLRFYGQTEATGTASSGDSSSEVKSFAEVDDSEHQTEFKRSPCLKQQSLKPPPLPPKHNLPHLLRVAVFRWE
jgi:hypothetical protein